jgi:hypothetical protein
MGGSTKLQASSHKQIPMPAKIQMNKTVRSFDHSGFVLARDLMLVA